MLPTPIKPTERNDWIRILANALSALTIVDIGANHVDELIQFAIRVLGATPSNAKLFGTFFGIICYSAVYFAINGDLLWKSIKRHIEPEPGQVNHSLKERPYLYLIYAGGLVKILKTLLHATKGLHPKHFLAPYTNHTLMSGMQFNSEIIDTITSVETYLGRQEPTQGMKTKTSNLGRSLQHFFSTHNLAWYLAVTVSFCMCITTLTAFYGTFGLFELTGLPILAISALGSFGLYFYPQLNFYIYSISGGQFAFNVGNVLTILYETESYWTLASYLVAPGFALAVTAIQYMGTLKFAVIVDALIVTVPAEVAILGISFNPVAAIASLVFAACFVPVVLAGFRYWTAFLVNQELVEPNPLGTKLGLPHGQLSHSQVAPILGPSGGTPLLPAVDKSSGVGAGM